MNKFIQITLVENPGSVVKIWLADIVSVEPSAENPVFTIVRCAEGAHYLVRESIWQIIYQMEK